MAGVDFLRLPQKRLKNVCSLYPSHHLGLLCLMKPFLEICCRCRTYLQLRQTMPFILHASEHTTCLSPTTHFRSHFFDPFAKLINFHHLEVVELRKLDRVSAWITPQAIVKPENGTTSNTFKVYISSFIPNYTNIAK